MLDKNRKTSLYSAALAVLSFISFGLFSVEAADELKAGDQAPSFSLMNQAGVEVSLSDYAGGWVVLYFYPKNDTPGCTTEACSFRDNINRLIAQEATVIGVSLDSFESHRQFAKKYKLPFDLLSDENGTIAEKYNALIDFKLFKFAKRHSFIIDPQGQIAKVYRKVDPDKHVREVMDDLKQLQANAS